MARPPLVFTFYIAAPIESVWNGFVSKETNQTIFMGADFEVDLGPGGAMTWSGPGKDGQRTRYVTGEVLSVDAPTRQQPGADIHRTTRAIARARCDRDRWASCTASFARMVDVDTVSESD